MTVLLGLLLTGIVFGRASAISGIESIHTDPQGTIITYWHGYGRLLALGYAAALCDRILRYLPALFCRLETRLRSLLSRCGTVHLSGLVDALAPAVRLGRCDSSHLCAPFAALTGAVGGADREVGSSEMARKRPKTTAADFV